MTDNREVQAKVGNALISICMKVLLKSNIIKNAPGGGQGPYGYSSNVFCLGQGLGQCLECSFVRTISPPSSLAITILLNFLLIY